LLFERKINEKEWHQAAKPLKFLSLLPPIGDYKILISLPCTSKPNKKNSFVLIAIIPKKFMHSNTKIHFHMSD
jgi:uncharacterized protein YrrD